jgi:hypothetical protein
VKNEEGQTVYVGAEDIQVSERETVKLPKHQSGRDVEAPAALLTSLLDSGLLQDFTSRTRMECVVIGQVNLLAEEARTPLAHQGGTSHYSKGALQDLLRAHELSRLQKDIPQSRLLPPVTHSRALCLPPSP